MTYSIVAHDPDSGAVGVAVQSHWFAVGPIVSWARAGIGAVATQSIAEPAYGPRLLDALAGGQAPQAALDALLAQDELARFRQVAVVDARGRVATHTGESCIGEAGHEQGTGFSVQANMMGSAEVWPAMAQAFDRASGPLPRRLLAALHAAEAQGGDVRGRQSAALLVVPAQGEEWERVDLRVDDHPDPIAEIDRLADLQDAYDLASEGDELTGEGRHAEAGDRYERAAGLAPGNDELRFWAALSAAADGDLPSAVQQVRPVVERHAGWHELLKRLEPEVAPGAADLLAALDGA